MGTYVLGLDPGFAKVGWALVELLPEGERFLRMGVWETKKSVKKRNVRVADDNYQRAQILGDSLDICICDMKFPIRVVAVESMSFPRSASAAAKMALFWGVLAEQCRREFLPLVASTPQELKKAVCGVGSASKEEIQQALLSYFDDPLLTKTHLEMAKTKREHPFDALGAVVAARNSEVFKMARPKRRSPRR